MTPSDNETEINLTGAQSTPSALMGSVRASVLYSKFQPSNDLPFIVRVLIKLKLVKNESQAQKVLLTVVLLFIIAAVAFFILAFKQPEIKV